MRRNGDPNGITDQEEQAWQSAVTVAEVLAAKQTLLKVQLKVRQQFEKPGQGMQRAQVLREMRGQLRDGYEALNRAFRYVVIRRSAQYPGFNPQPFSRPIIPQFPPIPEIPMIPVIPPVQVPANLLANQAQANKRASFPWQQERRIAGQKKEEEKPLRQSNQRQPALIHRGLGHSAMIRPNFGHFGNFGSDIRPGSIFDRSQRKEEKKKDPEMNPGDYIDVDEEDFLAQFESRLRKMNKKE